MVQGEMVIIIQRVVDIVWYGSKTGVSHLETTMDRTSSYLQPKFRDRI
jgi:hypothetical protein